MKLFASRAASFSVLLATWFSFTQPQQLRAQAGPQILGVTPVADEVHLRFTSPAAFNSRLERSPDLVHWTAAYTFPRTAAVQTHTETGARFEPVQYYRIRQLDETNALTGDHLNTQDGDVVIHPVNHASLVLTWKDQVIYVDPVGGASLYKNFPRPTLIFITDIHGDHADSVTVNGVGGSNAIVIAPAAVLPMLSASVRGVTRVLANGAKLTLSGLGIEGVPMYNITAGRLGYHSKGRGNGYILTAGGKRLYISGDTEGIPEMRGLTDIDAAFVCMNLPFTMDVTQAASAVREFRPRTIYPYHFSDSSTTKFKQLVGTDLNIEVRLRKWY